MAIDQTAGAPPRRGSTILAKSGCTAKRRSALRKRVTLKADKTPSAAFGDAPLASSLRAEASVIVGPLCFPAGPNLLAAKG
jgi:hypothetical protein